MGWGAAIAGAAALGGLASGFGASNAAAASVEAAKIQAEAMKEATKMQLDYLREVRADLAEAVEKGLIDLDTAFQAARDSIDPGDFNAIQSYVDLVKNPESVMDRPGIRFQYNQGIDALQSSFSRTSGGGLSGRMIKAAEEYGQNFASAALDAELARLNPLIANQTNISNLYSSEGTAKANLRVGGAGQVAGVTGQMVPSIAAGIQAQGNAAASGVINKANAWTNFASNISDIASDSAMAYAMFKSGLFKGL